MPSDIMMMMMHSPDDSLEFSLLQSRTLCWTNLVRSARSNFRRQPPQVRKSPPVLLFLVSSETEEKITNVKIDLQLWIVKIFSGDWRRWSAKCASVMKTSSVTFLLWSKFWFCLSSQPWIYNVWSMKIRKKQFGLIYWWYDSVPERIKSIWFRL